MQGLNAEERRLYACRNNSHEDMLAWLEAKANITLREKREQKQQQSQSADGPYAVDEQAFYCANAYQVVKFTQKWRDEHNVVERSKKQYRSPNGLRWAPHRGTMIPEDEWNEDEYQEWRAHHYMACYQKVQDLRDRIAKKENAAVID